MGIFAAVVIPAPGGTKNPHPAGVGIFLTTPWTKADGALFPELYRHPHPAGVGVFLTTPWTKADGALLPELCGHPHPAGVGGFLTTPWTKSQWCAVPWDGRRKRGAHPAPGSSPHP